MENTKPANCCPQFDPATWNEKTVVWENKLFIKKTLPTILHMPIPGLMGKAIGDFWKKAEVADAAPAAQDFLWLSYDPTPWKSEQYLFVTREVPDLDNVKLSGTFITKVFDGPYRNVPKWLKEMDAYLADQNRKAQKYYLYYTTCPKCAKIYGHNYVVILAQI